MSNNSNIFSFRDRVRSVRHAIAGVIEMFNSQHNAWIHLTATVCVIAAGIFFQVNSSEWCFLVLAILLVWVTEALNTAFEFLCDAVSPEFHPLVRKAKDVAAGAVLLSAVAAVIIGLVVFLPYAAAHL